MPTLEATYERRFGVVNVRTYGAVGDNTTDDTDAIQAAADAAFGSSSSFHGLFGAYLNKELYFPPGRYKITAPIQLTQLVGARVRGSGRFTTYIQNYTANSSVFVTNGCARSHFNGFSMEGSGTAVLFDLDWDGTEGGNALQSNHFHDLDFSGGDVGLRIGQSEAMGSENLIQNCFFNLHTVAGVLTVNYNALQQTIIGGNFQSCYRGVYVYSGSVASIIGVGFQSPAGLWDIQTVNGANDAMIIQGCRSESKNFANIYSQVVAIAGCSQTADIADGTFLLANYPFSVNGCRTVSQKILAQYTDGDVRGCEFGLEEWGEVENGAKINYSSIRANNVKLLPGVIS